MKKLLTTDLGKLRIVAFLEGISFLVLLFFAMPLKYIYGKPEFVRFYGSVHGALFVLYVLYVFMAASEQNWGKDMIRKLLLVSLVPFGNFHADMKWLRGA